MPFKIISGIVAAGLLITYLAPVAIKLKDVPFSLVVIIGVALTLIDLRQSIRSKDD
ncbi:MAG TPA: hypothetical protein VFV84_00250 [Burkholderiales bacterium]|nr:hypothetical protein [Burkholderiales bacterium]